MELLEELCKLGLPQEQFTKALKFFNANREVAAKGIEEIKKPREKIIGTWFLIRAIFNQPVGRDVLNPDKIVKTIAPPILAEVFKARDEVEAVKFRQRFPKKAKDLVVGREGLRARIQSIIEHLGYDNPESPATGIRVRRKKGYRPHKRQMVTGGKTGFKIPV